MCNVCDAGRLVMAQGEPVVYRWSDGASVEVRLVEGTQPEFTRATVQLRRTMEDPWSPLMVTEDLAGFMGRLGTDVQWEFVPESVKVWIAGKGPMPSLAELQVAVLDTNTEAEGGKNGKL